MDKIILGQGVVLEGGLGSSRPNENVLVVGWTGTGKSMSVLLPTMIHNLESSFIGTFAKSENVNIAVRYFMKLGYATKVWNLAKLNEGDTLPDPLTYVSNENDIQELAKQIAMADPDYLRPNAKFDPYWKNASQGLLTGLIHYVFMMSKKSPSMKKVLNLFYSLKIEQNEHGIKTSLDKQFKWLEAKYPNSLAVRKFNSFRQLPYGTALRSRRSRKASAMHVPSLNTGRHEL